MHYSPGPIDAACTRLLDLLTGAALLKTAGWACTVLFGMACLLHTAVILVVDDLHGATVQLAVFMSEAIASSVRC
jgi:hypothetical protein